MNTEEQSATRVPAERSSYARTYWPARVRVLKRLGLIAVVLLLLGLFAVGTSRMARMIGLPDVGDPFESSGKRETPSAAAAGYEQALARLHQLELTHPDGRPAVRGLLSWARADPAQRAWLKANQQTLALFRQGAESPRITDEQATLRNWGRDERATRGYQELTALALLEASRLQDQGDREGAWGWLRATLRANQHWANLGGYAGRWFAREERKVIVARLLEFSQDPAVPRALLRRMLDDVVASETLFASDLATLESGYRDLIRDIEAGHWKEHPFAPRSLTIGNTGMHWPRPAVELFWQGRRLLDNEPERSRRVVRLVFAQWRVWGTLAAKRRPKPTIRSVLRMNGQAVGAIDLFDFGRGAPPEARRLSARELAGWFETTDDAKVPLAQFWTGFQSIRRQERASHASLVLDLAEELYLRDHGTAPPNLEALVGPSYLRSLPDDGSSELDDGTTAVIEAQ